MSIVLNRTRVHPSRPPSRERPARPRLGERGPERARGPNEGRAERRRPRSDEPSGRPRGTERETERRATSEGRILIVDDERAIRLVCRLNLQNAGFETLEADDGKGALESVRAEHPDLILLDIMLPELDGWQVAEELGAGAETGELPILFLSARSDRADEERAQALGGVGYITKPFEPLEMVETVRSVLERVRRGERDALRREWLESLA